MRSLIILAFLGLVQANIDWDNVIPIRNTFTPPNGAKIPTLFPRIVGGDEAKPNSIPFQAALFIATPEGTYFCGGSLISKDYVLTAAHCVDKQIIYIQVVLGAHEVRAQENSQQIIISTEFKKHENYDSSTITNDVAVIKLPTPAVINEFVQTILLPTVEDVSNNFEGVIAQVSGWGKTSDSAAGIAEKLHVVKSDIISNKDCDEAYFGGTIKAGHICLNGDRYQSPCNGDSGGPLVYQGKVIGIVSFGIIFGCEVGWPGAFTRVTAYRDWIIDNAQL